MKKLIGVLVFLGMAALSANAYALTFDFAGTTSSQAVSMDFDSTPVSGITVTATGYYDGTLGEFDTAAYAVTRTTSGLGVLSVSQDNSGEIDGSTYYDSLVLRFSQSMTLNSAIFGDAQSNDQFRLYVDGIQWGGNLDISDLNSYNFGSVTGQVFRFTVSETNDDYRVASMTFADLSPVVPEPASMILMGLGLVGAAMRKRAKRA
jgi:hypothetical protein